MNPTNSCALLSTRAVRCWGSGNLGKNGYGNTNNIGDNETPFSVGDVSLGGPAAQISVGESHTCALLDTGNVRCWGRSDAGQLGLGVSVAGNTIGDNELPASSGEASVGDRVVQVSAGGYHTCALLQTGAVRCWGANFYGELGYGNTNDIGDDEPAGAGGDVPLGGAAIQVATGTYSTCAVLATGSVRCWGRGADGRLGYGNTNNIGDNETPASAGDVPLGGRAVQISVGELHTCALLETGRVRCWGFAGDGRLGYGNQNTIGDDEAPSSAGDVDVGGPVAQVAVGSFSCARLTSGTVRCWGQGAGGIGYGNKSIIGDNETPATAGDVNVGALVSQISVGLYHACAVTSVGEVRCWGLGSSGELGYGNQNSIGDNESPASAGDVPLLHDVQLSFCTGTATACSAIPEASCDPTPQCNVVGTCKQLPTGGGCTPYVDQVSCQQHPFCQWNLQLGCVVNPNYCSSLFQKSDCTISVGCQWQTTACSGTANCAQLFSPTDCSQQPGCTWQ